MRYGFFWTTGEIHAQEAYDLMALLVVCWLCLAEYGRRDSMHVHVARSEELMQLFLHRGACAHTSLAVMGEK